MPIWISLYDPNGHFLFSLVVATAYLFTMFGILFEFIRSFRNSATDYRSSIAFALDQFIKDHCEMGDDEIYEAILADVGNEDVANQIFVFLPISFTREHLKNQR